MGGLNRTGNFAHDQALVAAEQVRQSAVAAAAQSPAGQKASDAAEIAWARSCLASCRLNLNGQGQEAYLSLLRSLGVNS
jgi:hypothetical protein